MSGEAKPRFRIECADCGAWAVADEFRDGIDLFALAHYRVSIDPNYIGAIGHSDNALECEWS